VRRGIGVIGVICLATAVCGAQVTIEYVRQLRKERKSGDEVTYLYRFDGRHVTLAEQAAIRGKEAAEAWRLFDRGAEELPVVARSPFGGGETASTYWPAGVDAELLRRVVKPLARQGFHVVLPELPEESDQEDKPKVGAGEGEDEGQAQSAPPKPWPKVGFPEDYEFVLVVGLHHEPVPYKSVRPYASRRGPPVRSSRVNAWAILFHVPTGSGFWGAVGVGRADHRSTDEPLKYAAIAALDALDFSDIGDHNIPKFIKEYRRREELPALDVAALLVQTQRADAIQAVVHSAMTKSAFKNTAWVLRWFNQRGTVQDYRIDPARARGQGCVRVSQRVMMRVLLLEQLRGMRGVQPCVQTAAIPYERDIEVQPLGAEYGGLLPPLSGDDELVLLAELAHRPVWDRRGAFWRHTVQAVRNIGRCRTYIDEAIVVAKTYANRRPPRRRPGRRPRRDPLRQAGRAALAELMKAKAEQARQRAARRSEP